MTTGNAINFLLSIFGVFSMSPDDFGPYKIWFTLPGVFLMAIVGGIVGDWAQAKWKGRHDYRAIG